MLWKIIFNLTLKHARQLSFLTYLFILLHGCMSWCNELSENDVTKTQHTSAECITIILHQYWNMTQLGSHRKCLFSYSQIGLIIFSSSTTCHHGRPDQSPVSQLRGLQGAQQHVQCPPPPGPVQEQVQRVGAERETQAVPGTSENVSLFTLIHDNQDQQV